MDSLPRAPFAKSLTERHRRNLVGDIHDGQVAAIVGPELAVGPGSAGRVTLYEYLAQELTPRLGMDAGPRARTLLENTGWTKTSPISIEKL